MINKYISKVAKTTMLAIVLIGLYSCTSDRSDDFVDYDIDTDGDGIFDSEELIAGTDRNNPCDPPHSIGYSDYNDENLIWLGGDCDSDGLSNEAELLANNNPYGEPLIRNLAVPEFLPKLSELNLFEGDLSDFQYTDNVYEYNLSTPLYTDYAYKLRVVTVPDGEQIKYVDGGLLDYPDNTIMAKTFYYLNDERDPSLGKKIIETRVLIKIDGEWLIRDYVWNEDQTDAVLEDNSQALEVDWIDATGAARSVNYVVPSNSQCVQCHLKDDQIIPIGPKARAMNFVHEGSNVLQVFKDNELLTGAPDVSQIPVLPDWADETLSLEERARGYLDMNCAHCHQTGGSYNVSFGDNFNFTYETSFEDSNIDDKNTQIRDRMGTKIPGYFMPLIGTSLKHDEGIELINEFLDTLDE